MQPDFSVIIPIYNRAHLIGECLASVLGQSEASFEVILVDNNSTDDLAGALKPFSDSRIQLIKCLKPGPGAARNAGVRAARGKYLSFIDSDDLWSFDVLSVARPYMDNGAAVVYVQATSFSEGHLPDWRPTTKNDIEVLPEIGHCMIRGVWGTNAMCAVKRDALLGGHGFDEILQVGEDIDWALRHVASGPAILLRDRPRLAYRLHGANICKNKVAYKEGTLKLIERVRAGTYEIGQRRPLRRLMIELLMTSVGAISYNWGVWDALTVYPRVVRLGIHWREYLLVLKYLLILLTSWVKKWGRRLFPAQCINSP